MKARNDYAGAGRALKRNASKGARQDDQRAIRDGLIDKAENERLAPQEAFAEAVAQMGWTPAEAESDSKAAGVFSDLGPSEPSRALGDFQEPGLGGLSCGS